MYVVSLDSLLDTSNTISDVNPNSGIKSFAYLEQSLHNVSVSNQGTYGMMYMCVIYYPSFMYHVITTKF